MLPTRTRFNFSFRALPSLSGFTTAGLLVTAALFAPDTTHAQTCAEPVAADFRIDSLAVNTSGDLYEGNNNNGGESGNYGVVQLAVASDGKVFIAKMCSGQVRVYDPASGLRATTTLAGRVPTRCSNEDGLLGIVVDPNYATNKWIYVFHTDSIWPSSPANADTGRAHVLTRYTYDATAAAGAQLKSPKRLLRFGRMIDNNAFHAAGGLDISSDGTLIIGTGDDTSPHSSDCNSNNYAPILWNDRGCDAQKSSSNSADLRGKILRIKPIAFADNQTPAMGIGSTYTIPSGNLWEKIDKAAFNPNWNPAVDSVSKVRREIYTMGHRNPYHPRIDSKSGWIFTGEVGLDAGSVSATRGPEGREEWNLATDAGFFGHPYCVGKNDPWKKFTSPSTTWDTQSYNCAAIQNVSPNNSGITNLPPAVPSTLFYSNAINNGDDSYRMGFNSGETAIGGPMYRYDTALVSAGKFPPQYEGRVFFFDWAAGKPSFRIIKVNPNATVDSGTAAVYAAPWANMASLPTGSYIDMRFGAHDGAMYLLRGSNSQYSNFNQAALFRIRYVGTVNNACYTPFNATVGPAVSLRGAAGKAQPFLRRNIAPVLTNGTIELPAGYTSVEVYDLSGRQVWQYRRTSAAVQETVTLPNGLSTGILHARLF